MAGGGPVPCFPDNLEGLACVGIRQVGNELVFDATPSVDVGGNNGYDCYPTAGPSGRTRGGHVERIQRSRFDEAHGVIGIGQPTFQHVQLTQLSAVGRLGSINGSNQIAAPNNRPVNYTIDIDISIPVFYEPSTIPLLHVFTYDSTGALNGPIGQLEAGGGGTGIFTVAADTLAFSYTYRGQVPAGGAHHWGVGVFIVDPGPPFSPTATSPRFASNGYMRISYLATEEV